MRKKLFAFILGIIASTGYIGADTFVETLTSDYLTYEFETTNHTCKIIRSKDVADGMFIDANLVLREQILWNDIYYTVTAIGENAFSSHEKLQSIQFPSTLTTIGESAFSSCKKMKSVSFPAYCELSSVGENAFSYCDALTSFSFPMRLGSKIISIGAYAFQHCTHLKSVQLTYVRDIGDYAFYNCSSLSSVTIPNSVKSIGREAFGNCISLTSVTIPESVETIRIGGTFFGCTSLQTVVWNAKNCTIIEDNNGMGIFSPFLSVPISSITFGPQVESIPNCLCVACGLKSVSISNSVISIGREAFRGCDSLTSVTIPESVISIGNSAFASCDSLASIEVDANNPSYCSVDGVLYNKDTTALLQYPLGNTLTEYVIPQSVTSIGIEAFEVCDLTSITIGDGVTSIGEMAFLECAGLISIDIPSNVISIGEAAFIRCGSLTSITIGGGVTSIGGWAFYACSDLTAITCEATIPPACGEDVFGEVDKSIPLYVPKESINAYKNADQWKDFTNIYAIGSSPTAISNVQGDKTIGTKILREGQIVIRRGENTFTIQGQEVR